MKKIVYVNMDNVVVDFKTGIDDLSILDYYLVTAANELK